MNPAPSNPGTVSLLIAKAKTGDGTALAQLHALYWPRLVELARKRMERRPIRDRDAEDIAQDAFIAMYQALQDGKLPKMHSRHHWLAFLTHLIACRVVNEFQRGIALKRGGDGKLLTERAEHLWSNAVDREHSPAQQAILADCYQYYLDCLPEYLREFAELHLAGLSTIEIARELGCVRRTVERKLLVLEEHWRSISTAYYEFDGR